ncbi:hypothetical protein NEISICOT_00922 [Neisseria sicca ATCC 29256]|uniref:Uncharacterized protein n=1 Tax=Neisseria sicca ATCC 29256 TaxID=547045 RepID=C6M331_NEISI|nr:hypothetical protein NEISICOT_00922 [Neisseria sicca ATCC 29256]
MPRLAVLSVLSAASSPCPDLNLIHYILCVRKKWKVGRKGVISILLRYNHFSRS